MRTPTADELWLLDSLANDANGGQDPRRTPAYAELVDAFPDEYQAALARTGQSLHEAEIAATTSDYDAVNGARDSDADGWSSDDARADAWDDVDDNAALRVADDLNVPTLAEVAADREVLGRKFETSDMTVGRRFAARKYASNYEGDFSFMLEMRTAVERSGTLSDGQAKGVLNVMAAEVYRAEKAAQTKTREANTNPVADEGFYMHEGDVFRVKRSQIGRLYAMRWDGSTFDFEKGAVDLLHEDEVLTLEDAEKFGRRFGVCVVCSRTLTDPKSIARGIGPVCAKGWS